MTPDSQTQRAMLSDMTDDSGASTFGEGLRITNLPGPDARESEEQIAGYVEETIAHVDGRVLGPRLRRDGDGDLLVDFTYDAVDPPVAMEITSLVVPGIRALASELRRLKDALNETLHGEDLGVWWLGIRVGAYARDLERPLVDLIRSQAHQGQVQFSTETAPDNLSDADLILLDRLFDLGLALAARMGSGSGVDVFPPISSAMRSDEGFGTLLRAAMAANVEKLREARPRETHLVVSLDRTDLSTDPERTPAPRLLNGIDVLWVLLGYSNAKWTYRLWRTVSGDPRWELLRHPAGEPSSFYPAD